MNIHKNARLTQLGRERIVRMAAAGTASRVIARRQIVRRQQTTFEALEFPAIIQADQIIGCD